ncbi:MAG: retropepsin-like aspartic protease [Candidatus Aenigmarchaeota archaeon]|nr:retropepsin-like aspartic protease [Candidatus Aenigmarchaeota archaeon]
MKIPLEVTELPKGTPRIILNVSILFTRIGLKPMRFVIDTGSPKTFIGATDAIKLNLQPYSDVIDTVGYGMKEMKLRRVRIDKFYLKTDEPKLVPGVNISSLKMADPVMINEMQCMGMPNLIGLDFIKDNGFDLHFISSKNEAYLDK